MLWKNRGWLVLVLMCSLSPAVSFGWGKDGHIIVCKIAENHLSPRAREGIRELIGNRSLADSRLASWADLIKSSAEYRRKYPQNQIWHFTDIPLGSRYDPARDCKHNNCVAAQLERLRHLVHDRKLDPTDRKEALLFVIHLAADLHQPLHCAERNGDRGGNLLHVTYLGGADHHHLNLHQVWDTNLVDECLGDLNPDSYGERLSLQMSMDEVREWTQGSIIDWVNESHNLARQFAYVTAKGQPLPHNGEVPDLDEAYVDRGRRVVEAQLKRAGIRLAALLNQAFE